MKTVYCPVKEDNINGIDCYLICDIADGYVKSTLLPEDIAWDEEKCKMCKECQYHGDT